MSRFTVKRVAVLGAGVMGAQIAAHLVNVRVPVVLFDLPKDGADKSAIARQAIANLKKLKPSPLGVADEADLIQPANYDEHLGLLGECDLVIEAIAERMDWKHQLYARIAPHLASHAILATNTSGLPIRQLAEPLPAELRPRFCGIHFFNPPRYMPLVELIATADTRADVLDALEGFVTTTLGKNVVRAKDTPNFVANRIGIAGMLSTMREAERYGLTFDIVDDLTGKRLGRASSGTFRTADVVGLDTLAHVIRTMQTQLSPETDPFYETFATPAVLQALLDKGHLGQKTKAGFYKKAGRDVLRFDLAKGEYVPAGAKADEVYGRMLKKPAAERLKLLRNAEGPQGQFLWAILRNGFHYAALHLQSIAETARDVDQAMRWGFGMSQGPFELWQEAGWLEVARMVQEDIDAGRALCRAPLPDWVFHGPVAERGGVHQPEGSWNPATGRFEPPRTLPVHQRQLYRERVFGEGGPDWRTDGTTVYEDDAIRLWTLDRPGLDDVLIASIKTKMHAISPAVVEGLDRAVDEAEARFNGLVVWSGDEPFSVGADLQATLPAFAAMGVQAIESVEAEMQRVMLRLRYAQVPTVAAVRGMALGGGCELAVHCARRVAHMESYMGLVEVGVGLIPGAGGLTYIARRAAENARASTGTDLLPFLTEGFKAAAMATVGTSALESRKIGYLLESDVIVPHRDELLFVALRTAQAMHEAGYRPPLKRLFPVAGRSGKATILGSLVNMRDGGFITAYDFEIASRIAHVVTGGDVEAGTLVNEEYLMKLEREAFCALIAQPKTQERILGLLNTGKPVRN
ncbi:3-hydroxyacyl-CoA dehydrogenase/enoyl-CoA hydratase family protein [Tepidimonas taiwanensis]|uniref:Putative 3-hydroxyacyl-CoA dehydrogenase n=1 Tax=Tepidimonas taiwanensis TaxID=307486 RepID=A0A554XC03_9BURK|nr:3-hydroxyacyl-CoA dehydrogenase/enoyl-CoA hydratase family protein [Tepidimonas taiwanensis]MDM7464466.1 3-hydroxyacyl-CoA dehydrogenase/enoyl-CoA hydratase family protein [Tepidimonas taiwanensis]TSE33370.1 putative 3-hydroxyacyl-CoA dehydrogenase [Tepidimonas taiwanensis]UBQ04410.1 3-hydroxyacyl-CoA dehydrogenase/enoyl-CoA hydratase family protein [Tepidimonas taiwanensis]